ncbi:Conjugative transfer protein 123 [Enterobacter hormaechei]|uniref:Ig-like domain-containing protein n=1 Tax=Enterobacter hormaechei TaxID=158836 RepID=UPI0012519A3A|nr:Ig-like domain-containing protein [Enterobacter hormaechei]VAE21529.1 Conjugative transfer protein 123 [Enterobacter hormaechei]VAE27082.1 Conjugative transfer protein 123 [Enterobacter hormaechei]
MNTDRLFLRLAPLLALSSMGIHAQVSELVFKDTLNAIKYLTPDKVWMNPATGFDVQVITGLDRYVDLSLIDSASATVWNARSTKVTVEDRLKTSTGTEFYGKRQSVPAVAEGSYILREIIYDLQNKEVSRTDYPISIDRTAPITGTIGYTRGGWTAGSDASFTNLFTGITHTAVQALVFNGLGDANSGLDQAEYFTVDPSGQERKKSVPLNLMDGTVTIQMADAANATITPVAQGLYQIGVRVFDKAGNRAELSRISAVDRTIPWYQFQVLNGRTGSWDSYVPNMVVYSNPIKVRTVRRKADFVSDNGTPFGWADKTFQTSDAEYKYYDYNYVYPNNTNNQYDIQTNAGGVTRIHDSNFKFTPDPTMDLGPKNLTSHFYRSDTDTYINNGTTVFARTLTIGAFRATMEPRKYPQKIRSATTPAYNCIIPVGDTSCEMQADLRYLTGKGSSTIYIYGGKTDNNVYDTRVGGWTVIWDTNPPEIQSASVSRSDKTILMTVVDNDRVNTTFELNRFDTKVFNATIRDEKGKVTVLTPKTSGQSDFKTKNAVFSYASLPDGRYTVESVSATDLVGNTATQTLNETLFLDSVAPTISFTYQGVNAEGKLIKGLENLTITLSDASGEAHFTSLNLTGGPNKENVSLTTTRTGVDTYVLEYPRLFPNISSDDGSYKLTVSAVDGSGNKSTKVLNFQYEPDNLIVLDRMKTLGSASALKTSDDKPLAFLKTTQLRSKDGSIITGRITGTLAVRKDSSFPITLAGVTVAPGETKEVSLDMGQGEERLFAITPAVNGVSGSAIFSLIFEQI